MILTINYAVQNCESLAIRSFSRKCFVNILQNLNDNSQTNC
jgi:hypothetical protein